MSRVYVFLHRYICERCQRYVESPSGWRWCDECRAEEYAKSQRASKRRYAERMKLKNRRQAGR